MADNIFTDVRNTKGNLNPTDTEGDTIILRRSQEEGYLEELPTPIETLDVSSDTIWGSFNWAGANWDGTYTNTYTIIRILCPGSIFKDYLRDNEFTDTSNTTATMNYTNFDITFTTGEIYQSKTIFKNNTNIIRATLVLNTDNITGSGNLTYYLSSNGGSNWEEVTLNTEHTFTNIGQDLRIKIVASDSAAIDIENTYGVPKPIQVSFVTSG